MNAFLLPVGDEILIGQIIDSNSAYIAQQLNLQGISVRHAMSISDKHNEIIKAITYAFTQADIIIMTGGLGPTKDDITKKAIADFLGVEMFFHEDTWYRIVKIFQKFGRETNESHRIQCFMPQGVEILTNKMGTAPGMWFEVNGKILISMPGVPSEMKYLMDNEVMPRLKEKIPGLPIAHRTILTAGVGETDLEKLLEDFENNLADNFKIAYLPSLGQVRLRLTGRHENETFLQQQLDENAMKMESIVAEYAYGRGEQTLEEVIGNTLRTQNKKIATAESCTGGLISHKITSVAGSSDYFIGSIIAYAYEAKVKHLNVKQNTLDTVGAVSEECVKEMVWGVIDAMEVDYGIAVSGIAGPGGGTPEKPVGTIWLAVGSKENIITRKISINRNRAINIEYAANIGLILLWQMLKK
jgi:nicotinamide-nucleotide amidase